MKLSSLSSWFGAHKALGFIIIIIFCGVLAAGGWYGWIQYQYRQTSEYALEKIKAALSPPQAEELARLVDFNSVTAALAEAISKDFSFYQAGPDQRRNIGNILQTALLARFMKNEEPSKAQNQEENEEKELQKPLIILPPDFATQLANTLALRETGPDSALLSAKIQNPQLNQTFILIFGMRKTAAGWQVQSLANAKELVSQLRNLMLKRHNRLREVYEEKNAATNKKMRELLPIQACAANAGLLSDGKTLLMVVQVIARNLGDVQVNNFTVDTSIIGHNGQLVEHRYLNAAKPVGPGEDFNHRWNFELDSQSPLAQRILMGIPLQCEASWQTLGLGNSQVWHIVEVPNQNRACLLEGHDHPEGFCLMPLFQE